MTDRCFHCHEKVTSESAPSLIWSDKTQYFCCDGCHAVAQAIISNGLDDYYKFRTETSVKPDNLIPQELRDIELLDDPEVQQQFTEADNDFCHVELGVEGITCAACSWLIESTLLKDSAVSKVQVNPITHRIKIKWNNQQQQLSSIIKAISQLGYKSYPFKQSSQEQAISKENKRFLMRLGVAGLGMMQVMMFAVGIYIGDATTIDVSHKNFLHWVSGLVATPIVFYSARPFFRQAWNGLKARKLVMDLPVAIAISAAYSASVWATITERGTVYFDSISMFVFFLLLGRYLEHRIRVKAINATQKQRHALPLSVTKLVDNHEQDIALHRVNTGDLLVIRSGELIPVDGTVASGKSYVDESLLTGESKPVSKQQQDHVLAGTVNQDQTLTIQVTATGNKTYYAALENMTEQAHIHKPKIGQLADQVAHWFVLGLLLIVAAVYGFWFWQSPDDAFWIALSVLVVSCPCALSLATPTALTTASHQLSKLGMIILKPESLPRLSEIDVLAMDKTGTLTEGVLSLSHIETNFKGLIKQPEQDYSTEKVLDILCAIERQQTHPIAKAILANDNLNLATLATIQYPGLGVSASHNSVMYRLGKLEFAAPDLTVEQAQELQKLNSNGETVGDVWLSANKTIIARLSFDDQLKPGSEQLVSHLNSYGIATLLLSGDHDGIVQSIKQRLNFSFAKGDCSPEQKAELIIERQQAGKRVMMVGDGLNDTLVLATADVGLAIDTASDITQLNADAVLTNKNLLAIAEALKTAKSMMRIIKQNFSWAIGYNLVALPAAASGLVEPWLAAIGMTSSSIIVVINALRLNRLKLNLTQNNL
ncbi:MAG: heavy metal translocating P-type ATPase [Kangiellaceae bacterium]|jgi:Cu2+-exporting ATPase|nr:heavy metal translocating P-type ATPase [Kangiellaceae bacterium]